MWLFFWSKYSISKLATFVSIVGAFVRYAGVTCLFSGLIPAALICIGIGAGFHFGAEAIAFGAWKKKVHKNGFDQRIQQGDVQLAVELYKGNAKERTLTYFESLNPQVASQIREMIAKK